MWTEFSGIMPYLDKICEQWNKMSNALPQVRSLSATRTEKCFLNVFVLLMYVLFLFYTLNTKSAKDNFTFCANLMDNKVF